MEVIFTKGKQVYYCWSAHLVSTHGPDQFYQGSRQSPRGKTQDEREIKGMFEEGKPSLLYISVPGTFDHIHMEGVWATCQILDYLWPW